MPKLESGRGFNPSSLQTGKRYLDDSSKFGRYLPKVHALNFDFSRYFHLRANYRGVHCGWLVKRPPRKPS